MSTKIELEFFSADEKKLPEESGDVLVIWSHTCGSERFHHIDELHYSKKHNAFNVYDHYTPEDAEAFGFQGIVAWAHIPDWSKVDV